MTELLGAALPYTPLVVLALGVWVLDSFRNSGDQWDQYHRGR